MSSKIEEQIKEQLKEQFHRAFYDNIKHSVETQNYDHIVKLYAEIQDRLAAFLKKDGPTYNRLKQDFDVTLNLKDEPIPTDIRYKALST